MIFERGARARYQQAPQLWRVAFGSILYCKDTVSTCVYYRWFPLYTLLGFTFVKNGLLRFTWHFHKGTSFLIIVIFIFLKRKHLIIVLLLLVGDLFNPSRRFPLKTVEEWFTLFVRLVLDGGESTGSVKNLRLSVLSIYLAFGYYKVSYVFICLCKSKLSISHASISLIKRVFHFFCKCTINSTLSHKRKYQMVRYESCFMTEVIKLCKLSVNQKKCYDQFGVDIIF